MENQINPSVIVAVRMVADKLTTDELLALYMAAMQGFNPVPVMGYEKAKGLFTEFGGARMHRDTLAVFGAIVDERLAQQK